MEGLEKMGKMRRLNLSFNKLTEINEKVLSNMTFLEYLELGKNFISSIDCLPTHKLLMLQELYLYSNQIQSLPKTTLSFQSLKVFNLNRN